MTPEEKLLANRAIEILGRVDAATNELAAQVGLQAGQVRLAANASTLSTIVPRAAASLAQAHPANHRHSAWIGGCDRCQAELITVCRHEGFTPRIASHSDDMVVVQALVSAGAGVTTLPGLALQAHRRPDIHATELTGFHRQLYAATYGDPPDPPAVAAVLAALAEAAAPTSTTITGADR